MRYSRIQLLWTVLALCAIGGAVGSTNSPLLVTDITVSQRTDGSRLVDIRYDLAHNAIGTVWVVLSGDGGLSWSEQGDLP